MADYRTMLERARGTFVQPDLRLEAVVRERHQRRRNRRILAGAVGLVVVVAAAAAGASLLHSATRPLHRPPTPSGPPLRRGGEILTVTNAGLRGVDPTTGAARVLVRCDEPCLGIDEYSWSPDGRWVAYDVVTCIAKTPCEPQAGVWVMGAVGPPRHVAQSCVKGQCFSVAYTWSPDGTRLAFGLLRDGGSDVYVADVADTNRVLVAQTNEPVWGVAWVPGSEQVAYTTARGIFRARADGSGGEQLTAAAKVDGMAWSPDGARVAFETTSGRDVVWIMNADGSGLHRVLDEPSPQGPSVPVWSPDGTKFAFVATPGTAGHFVLDVWVSNADGSNRVRLYESPCCIGGWQGPVWSPDGTKVAFHDDVVGQWLVAAADGAAHPKRIDELTALGWRNGS